MQARLISRQSLAEVQEMPLAPSSDSNSFTKRLILHRKWPDVKKYLIYFQFHPQVEVEGSEQAINNEPGGRNQHWLRPDCLPDGQLPGRADRAQPCDNWVGSSDDINVLWWLTSTLKRSSREPKSSPFDQWSSGETHEMMMKCSPLCDRWWNWWHQVAPAWPIHGCNGTLSWAFQLMSRRNVGHL